MCTVIVSLDPASDLPVLLVGVRDEFSGRPWSPPAAHWPGRPELVGGIDLEAGGTWLALNTADNAVACVLNGEGRPADPSSKVTRGELPLVVASGGSLGDLELAQFDPFHVVRADLESAHVWSWDGLELSMTRLRPGLHFVVNSGLEATGEMARRVDYFRPRLLAAPRPTGDWGSWLSLVDGDGLDQQDPRALIVRREASDGQFWGSSSISLITLAKTGVRYDFSADPGSGAFSPVDLS